MASKVGVGLGIMGALLAAASVMLAGGAKDSLKTMRLSIEDRPVPQAAETRVSPREVPGGRSSAYETKTVQRSSDGTGASRATFRLSYPEFKGFDSELVNSGVMRKVCKLLDVDAEVDEAADAFIMEHAEFVADFPDYKHSWHFTMEVKHQGTVGNVVCMEISHQGFTGGAHGTYGGYYVLLDKTTGLEVDWTEMIVPGQMGAFADAAERAFRRERGLSAEADLKDAGFWFTGGIFTLDAAEIGFADQGVIVHFNTYTVAPHALGVTTYVIPAADLAGIVDIKGAVARAGTDVPVY